MNGIRFVLTFTAFFVSSIASAATFSGKSEAEFTSGVIATMTTKNTEYLFDRGLVEKDGKPSSTNRLYEIHKTQTLRTGEESPNSDISVTALDPATQKKLWTLEDRADVFKPHADYFTVRTAAGGDCETSQRLYDEATGKYLFAYSFAQRSTEMPIVLRTGAFSPSAFRFLAYHDSYWPCRDRGGKIEVPEGLTLAGVITWAQPTKVIQKIAVFFDQKAYNDPSQDPQEIEMSYKGEAKKFTGFKGESPAEYEYWWRKKEPTKKAEELGDRLYSGLNAKFKFPQDVLEIPIEGDRLDLKKAKLGKFYKKLVELPESDWAQF